MGKRIFFICPDDNVPRGGIRVIYRHATLLKEMGFEAYILHMKPNFKCDWFHGEMPDVAYPKYDLKSKLYHAFFNFKEWIRKTLFKRSEKNYNRFKLGQSLVTIFKTLPPIHQNDLLVLPEYNASTFVQTYPGVPYIIFNQNAYLTFEFKPVPKKPFALNQPWIAPSPYLNPFLKKVIVVSDDNFEYLKYVFPAIKMDRVHLSIDYNLFNDESPKEFMISFMPRKGLEDARQVLAILAERGNLKNWKVFPLDNMSQDQIASHLRSSAIFLSFAEKEGFSLPILEALASGCIVVGYHGEGGREIIQNPIEAGNIIAFVKKVEEIALQIEQNRENLSKKEAIRVREEYTLSQEKEDLMRIYSSL